jgi:serine/threonine protein phosphatase PrpC
MTTHSCLQLTLPGRKPGNRACENQDRLLARSLHADPAGEPTTLIAVADGISQCPYGGSVARYVIDQHLKNDAVLQQDEDPATALPLYLSKLYKGFVEEFAEMPDMLDSGCTLTVAIIRGRSLTYGWVGDSPLFVIRAAPTGYTAQALTRPDLDRMRVLTDCFGSRSPCHFKAGSLALEPGDITVVATDGASLSDVALAASLTEASHGMPWLESLASSAQNARFYDDISMVALKC